MTHIGKTLAGYRDLVRQLTPGAYRARRTAAIFLAVSPPFICALFVTGSNQWALFERSGSLTAAIGLLLASRQYLQPGLVELAIVKGNRGQASNVTEQLEEIYTRKMGLAVSAFGSIIMGWGSYLRWWTFGYLAIWAALAALDAWLDFVRLRDAPIRDPTAATRTTGGRHTVRGLGRKGR